MNEAFYDAVAEAPVIAAVKNQEGLEACVANENIRVVFLLCGDILTLPETVETIKNAGKIVIVHLDFISGLLSAKEISVDYIRRMTRADGIITTHPNCIRRAVELGLYTVVRAFVLDSIALENVPRLEACHPDFIEVLPGVMPKVIRRLSTMTDVPLLAGGLLSDKEDVIGALDAGAAGISTTDIRLWNL